MKRLRFIRLIQGLTQIELAYKSGVSASRISLIECGYVKPSSRDSDRLATTLKVDEDELIEDLQHEVVWPHSKHRNHP